jgi:hypothetical protein
MSSTSPFPRALLVLAVALAVVGAATIVGCNDEEDEIGTPCETPDDCSDSLICDIHGGQGTCQHPHGH